jgi:hypothetical protein
MDHAARLEFYLSRRVGTTLKRRIPMETLAKPQALRAGFTRFDSIASHHPAYCQRADSL